MQAWQYQGPAWTESDGFEIQAIMPKGATKDQLPDMLLALLQERFHLLARHLVSQQPVYALVVGKNGPKLDKPIDVHSSICAPDKWNEEEDRSDLHGLRWPTMSCAPNSQQ